MAWAKLDDAILDNPKIIAAGPLGFALHVAAITWSARNLTDGFVPTGKVEQLVNWRGVLQQVELASDAGHDYMTGFPVSPFVVVEQLVSLQLWHEVPGGYLIHDFLDYNRSKAQVLRERSEARGRKGKGSSAEVRPNLGRSSGPPVPVPVPVPRTQEEKHTRKARTARRESEWPEDLTLTEDRAGVFATHGCADPSKAFEAFRLNALSRQRRCSSWDMALRQWALHHDQYGCPCQKRGAPRRLSGDPNNPATHGLTQAEYDAKRRTGWIPNYQTANARN